MRLTIILMSVCMLAACPMTAKPKSAMTVDLYSDVGDKLGDAKLTENPDGVKIKLNVKGLTPGFHGLHIHEHAKCEGPHFESAGNHFNPKDKKHGLLNPKGPHVGDLKNIEADKDGKVNVEITADGTTLLEGDKKDSLTENGGTSLIITSKQDDGMTQVSGDSGERIVCGKIKEKGSDE